MPTLDWIGKKAVVNHHREVPYRLLHCDKSKSAGDPDAGKLLVQGCTVPDDRLAQAGLNFRQTPYQIEGL